MSNRTSDDLTQGEFGLCHRIFDEKLDKYIEANPTQVKQCCLNTCGKFVVECRKECDKNCDRCDYMTEACQNNCNLAGSITTINSPIIMATSYYGCGNNQDVPINMDCLINNRDNIIKQCNDYCIPTIFTDCETTCDYAFKRMVGELPNPLIYYGSSNSRHLDSHKSSFMWNNIIVIIITIFFIIILLILFKKI